MATPARIVLELSSEWGLTPHRAKALVGETLAICEAVDPDTIRAMGVQLYNALGDTMEEIDRLYKEAVTVDERTRILLLRTKTLDTISKMLPRTPIAPAADGGESVRRVLFEIEGITEEDK